MIFGDPQVLREIRTLWDRKRTDVGPDIQRFPTPSDPGLAHHILMAPRNEIRGMSRHEIETTVAAVAYKFYFVEKC